MYLHTNYTLKYYFPCVHACLSLPYNEGAAISEQTGEVFGIDHIYEPFLARGYPNAEYDCLLTSPAKCLIPLW